MSVHPPPEFSPTSNHLAVEDRMASDSDHTPDRGASMVLDFLFPGFGVFADTIQQHIGIDMGLYVHLALGFGVLIYLWLQISDFVGELARKVFLSTAEIRPEDEAYVSRPPSSHRGLTTVADRLDRTWSCLGLQPSQLPRTRDASS